MMVYILKSLVKISLAWLVFSNISYADIIVDEQNIDSTKIKYFLDYELDNDLKKIIDKGISIQILETIIVKRKNKYFFDNVVFKRTKKFKIEYHPLIKKFYFFEENEKFSFAELNKLVSYINKPWYLTLENTKDSRNKEITITWEVDQKNLPKSLQLSLKKPKWTIIKSLRHNL
ncbi:hypothetical protein UZ34_00260 [Methylophilales bacterium MBRSF5]|uniref:DUF4390 domain-containing protein n=1 Tax=Methylophilales bacterium MBRS-H7 TaxID=1623450 RepID=A0A0H4IYX8_9PROT|nr:hypothetical protein UZ34_00260 [Methylophilales bacterium MBRSF5]AKO65694.1 hypothetical protein VI33_02860 [Methylophilales bacterium MBRS-H7]